MEVFPSDSRGRSYFERFEDVGIMNNHLKNSEFRKVISHLNNVLSHQPLLGINNILEDNDYDNKVNENRRILLRDRRAVEDNGTKDYTETVNTIPDFKSNTETTTNSGSFVTTSPTSSSSTGEQVTTTTPTPNSQCVQDMERILNSVVAGEQWSLQFIDSWGKPGPGLLSGQLKFIGSYRECRSSKAPPENGTENAGFQGNYCSVGLGSAAAAMDTMIEALVNSAAIEIGACMPSSCSAEDVFGIFTEGLKAINLTSVFTISTVDCRTEEREYTAASIIAIIFLSIIGVLMILGTGFDILFVQFPKLTETRQTKDALKFGSKNYSKGYHPIGSKEDKVEARFTQDEEEHVGSNDADDYSEDKIEKAEPVFSENRPLLKKGHSEKQTGSSCVGILSKVLMAFSVYTNGKKMLDTSQPQGSLGAIHGIRFLSMSWVILGHTYIFTPGLFVNLATAMPEILNRWTFDVVSNALVSVDTFFSLSGLLVAYLTTKEIQKKGWKINWAMYYFHRFWRLTPPYMLILVIALGLHRFLGTGALWGSLQPQDKTSCEDNWWTNLLYINNFVNTRQMCMVHSWYLANDMQFYVLSPLMIVPFYFNMYAGIGSCLLFLIASWTTTGILSTDNDWPNSLLNGAILKPGTKDYQHYYYYAPYCRIGPFVIGILAGYLLAITKGKINMKWYYVVIGWVVAISVALASVYGIHGDITGGNPSSVGVSAFYNAVARSAWGACICWVIVACACGYGGPVNAILSWSPFVSLGRLTYLAYLIHPTVIHVYFENMDQLYFLNDTNFVISYLGILAFTNMAAFVLVLALESPMIGLEKVFLTRH